MNRWSSHWLRKVKGGFSACIGKGGLGSHKLYVELSVGYSVTFWPFGVSGYIYQTKKMMGIWHVSCWWTFDIKFLRGKVHFSDHAYHRDCLCCTKYWKEFVMLLLLQLFTGPAYSGKFLIEIIQIQIILIERRFFKSMAETWKHAFLLTTIHALLFT